MSATAATPLENKEGLIISDGNSRINNRGLVRRSRRGLLVRGDGDGGGEGEAVVEEGNGEKRGRVICCGGEGGKGGGDVGG